MANTSSGKLIAEYEERRGKNSRYSERAFAKSVGLSAGFLKLVFQGKRALSAAKAREVADRIGWSEAESDEFLGSVLTEKRARREEHAGHTVDSFAKISEWHHFAIVELIKIERRISVKEIAARLGITTSQVQFSLRALARHGLLKLEKLGPVAAGRYVVPALSAPEIRKFHAQMLAKAQHAVEGQPAHLRELRGLTLAFDSRKKKEAALMIQKFTRGFERRFSGGRPDKVYQLTIAFFSLEEDGGTVENG